MSKLYTNGIKATQLSLLNLIPNSNRDKLSDSLRLTETKQLGVKHNNFSSKEVATSYKLIDMQVCHVHTLLVRDIEALVRDILGIIIIICYPSKVHTALKYMWNHYLFQYACVLALSPDPFPAC